MVKFLCGLTLGVLGTVVFCYSDTLPKMGGIIVGTVLGAALAVITLVVGMQACQYEIDQLKKKNDQVRKKNERKDNWWKNGEKPPWVEDDD